MWRFGQCDTLRIGTTDERPALGGYLNDIYPMLHPVRCDCVLSEGLTLFAGILFRVERLSLHTEHIFAFHSATTLLIFDVNLAKWI